MQAMEANRSGVFHRVGAIAFGAEFWVPYGRIQDRHQGKFLEIDEIILIVKTLRFFDASSVKS